VYIVHRRDRLRASAIIQQRALANPKIEVIWNKVVEEIEGGDNADNGGMELDVIALCCDYAEGSADEIASDYSIDLSDCDDDEKEDAVREYLENHTSIVGETSTGFVYAKF